MSKAHYILPTLPEQAGTAVRLGTTGAKFADVDVAKIVKLAAESQYSLTAAGDPIEAIVLAIEKATSAGYTVGTIINEGRALVIADGLQATPGTGTIAVGDYVVTGTVAALGTANALSFAKVCKATVQPFTAVTLADNVVATINAGLVTVAAAIKNSTFAWRVVSLGSAGTGAVGTQIVIERVNA